MKTVGDIKLSDFAQMVRMSAEGKPHFMTHTVRLPDAAAPEVENAKAE